MLHEAIQSQMSNQIALKNQIGSEVIDDKIGDNFRRDFKEGVVEEMGRVKKIIVAKQGLDGGDEHKRSAEGQEAMSAMLVGKLEGFMRDFKDSLMPDIEALLLKAEDEKEQMRESELAAVRQEKEEHDFALKAD